MKYQSKKYFLINDYKNTPLTILMITFIFLITALIVYITGGTKHSYLHIVYIPILISAYFFKGWGGFISGIIAGIILGPFMPIDTNTMAMQATFNWSFRMVFFVLIGTFAGILFKLLENQLNRIHNIAYYDKSTGLPNKTKFRKIINNKIRKNECFHVVVLSIKNFSDIYNLIGSKNFSKYISVLIDHIKDYKKIKRELYYLNDSKYVMVLKKHEKKKLISKLRKFNNHLNSPIKYKNISIFTDIIMGISTYPDNGINFDELIEKSFISINKASSKKINFWIYQNEKLDIDYNNIELLGDINKSLKKNHFELYYQPKINLSTNKVDTFEALIRWNHPDKGLIPPNKFIPKVEQSSLIDPLTSWVIKESISDIKDIEESKEKMDMNIAINVSARNFQDPNFIDNLLTSIDKYNIQPSKFAIEITETDLMIEMEDKIDKLRILRDEGIKIYLDDFGKGYSSLKYLKELPIDFIKIDQFFVNNIHKEKTNKDIVLSIIKLSHALGIKVVAEGVETKEQLEYLRNNDCDYAQGYYFIKPDRKEIVIDWVEKFNTM